MCGCVVGGEEYRLAWEIHTCHQNRTFKNSQKEDQSPFFQPSEHTSHLLTKT